MPRDSQVPARLVHGVIPDNSRTKPSTPVGFLASPASNEIPREHSPNFAVYAILGQMVWTPASDNKKKGVSCSVPEQATTLTLAKAARRVALGEALLDRGRVAEARSTLLSARQLLPAESPIGLPRLALCHLLLGDAPACRATGETLRRIAPSQGWGDLAVAAGFALESDARRAWPFMANAAEKSGGDPELLVRLGGVALMLKEDLTAADYFRRALALEPGMPGAEEGLGVARELVGTR
jgi:tetratricopeptide (TPR) repeat protein